MVRRSPASSAVTTVSQLPFLLLRDPARCHHAPRGGELTWERDCLEDEEERLKELPESEATYPASRFRSARVFIKRLQDIPGT